MAYVTTVAFSTLDTYTHHMHMLHTSTLRTRLRKQDSTKSCTQKTNTLCTYPYVHTICSCF
jgi:hypothetical protein